jgi:hypothetical protein
MYLFVGEISWRFNHRNLGMGEQARTLLNLVTKIGGRIQ